MDDVLAFSPTWLSQRESYEGSHVLLHVGLDQLNLGLLVLIFQGQVWGDMEALLSSPQTWCYVLGTPELQLLEEVHKHPSTELALLEGAVGQ